MTQPFIDTDVLIRFLTGDDLKKQAAAAALFEHIEQGLLGVAAPDTVIADAVYVLSSPRLYHVPRTCTSKTNQVSCEHLTSMQPLTWISEML